MGFLINLFFSDGDNEVMDEVFDTIEEACESADECIANYKQGGEYLALCGEEYNDDDIVDYEILKVVED